MIHKSNSNSSIDSLTAYRGTGADLSSYQEELQKQRSAKTLTMRRRANPWSLPIKCNYRSTCKGSFLNGKMAAGGQEPPATPKMSLDLFMKVMESNDNVQIVQLSDDITKMCETAPYVLEDIIRSSEALECFTNAFMFATEEDVTKSLLISMTALFPLCGENMDVIINCGLAFKLYDLLESCQSNNMDISSSQSSALCPTSNQFNNSEFLSSTENSIENFGCLNNGMNSSVNSGNDVESMQSRSILPYSINLVISVSKFSSYGRNSLLCGGIHELLIKTALTTHDSNISIGCCVALQFIFENNENVDCDIVENCFCALVQLLSLPHLQAKSAVLSMLRAITCQMPKVVEQLCQAQVHLRVLRYIQSNSKFNQYNHFNHLNEDDSVMLISSLKLLSCLNIASPQYLNEMFDNGLMSTLLSLMTTEYTADALHVLSKFTEKSPDTILSQLPSDFVERIIHLANSSPFAILKESVFFLTIIIKKLDQQTLVDLINPDVIGLLVDMLASGQNDIILCVLEALANMIHVAECGGKIQLFASLLYETDVFDALADLGENRLTTVSDRAVSLTTKLNAAFHGM
ncbi:hypothetical protein TRFO_35560 [Tritrichomonas foetus]|uniref:Armadillo repeat-containing domain-containing protein n=1 Tax=Tritrichomonas foetus TaxID=1144522 RepID=A0A1J4JKJ4_9EUKA|nr:hypothetical protein TRFO_35560 [Tritrichomonas foetus]|eukprot:OHS98093.1 hypothetical protein TRFO_35560 [Tritrichomonas foetus]